MARIGCIAFLLLSVLSCSSIKNSKGYDQMMRQYRDKYKNDFLHNPRSPLTKDDLKYLDFFNPDGAWKLSCTCTETPDAQPFEMPTYSGVTRTYIKYATAQCKYKKNTIQLQLYKNIHTPVNPLYKNNIFLPFKDLTNGDTTYGGGRYINLLDTDIKDGKIDIDFNKAYNPWCAYSDGYNCPIPPRENNLQYNITAGEKIYKGEHKKSGS